MVDMVDGAPDEQTTRVVTTASKAWKNALVDTGHRNNALYFRDLRAATLRLAPTDAARPDKVERSFRAV